MNRLRTLMLMVWLCFVMQATGQQAPITEHRLSATQAVELALKQRVEILNAQIDVKNQDAYNREITGAAYPQVAGNFGVQHYFNIPVTVLPDFISPSVYGVLTKEGVQGGNGQPITAPESYGSVPAQFGTPWQASLGVSVQQLLFQPEDCALQSGYDGDGRASPAVGAEAVERPREGLHGSRGGV